MPSHLARLKEREQIAEGTMAFHFEKPSGFQFQAGQFITLTLIDPPEMDAEGDTRAFSIASAPCEAELMLATRMRDTALKRFLRTMVLGSSVEIRGPFGSLILHSDASRPAVLLAGSIGITPFRSILVQEANGRLAHRLFLFYSNRRPEDAAFLAELQALQNSNPNYSFIGTMTEMTKSSRAWEGERGFINKGMLVKFVKDPTEPIYYVAGPPSMVDSMRRLLDECGVGESNVRLEKFVGYS